MIVERRPTMTKNRSYMSLIALIALLGFTPAATASPAAKGARTMNKTTTVEKATFAAGCFWGGEAAFRQIKGGVSTQVGSTGGPTKGPSYQDVFTERTRDAQ